MNGQRRRRYFAAGCSFTIAESRRGDWVGVATAAHYFESKRVSAESSAKCGRLFWPLGRFSLVNPRPSISPVRGRNQRRSILLIELDYMNLARLPCRAISPM